MATPNGKGIFLLNLPSSSHAPAMAAKFAAAGVRWVCLYVVSQRKGNYGPKNVTQLPAYAKAFQQASIAVWTWAWPEPWAPRADYYQAAVARTAEVGAVGHITDPEAPWYKTPHAKAEDWSGELAERLESAGLGYGVSSFGAPWYHGAFPFKAFAKHAHFGVPQVYDGTNGLGLSYPNKGIAAYEAAGFRAVCPALGAHNKTPAQLLAYYEATDIDPATGCVWWYYNTLKGKSRWAAFSAIDVPTRSGALLVGGALAAAAAGAALLIKRG